MINYKRIVTLLFLGLVFFLSLFVFLPDFKKQSALISYAFTLDEKGQLPGEFTGYGTTFDITRSTDKDITVAFNKETQAHIQSITGMVGMRISSTKEARTITISNLKANTMYYKYVDHLDNREDVTSDDQGSLVFQTEASKESYVMIFDHPSTYFIEDNSTGRDCTAIGSWNNTSKTCTLNQNLTKSIEIKDNGITLDGAGKTIQGPDSNIGIYVNGGLFGDITDVTVKNITVRGFSKGIQINNTQRVHLINVTSRNNVDGVEFYRAENSSITGSTITSNTGKGLIVGTSSDINNISNNTITSNGVGIDLGLNSQSTITRNNIEFNGNGIAVSAIGGNNTILWQNNFNNTKQVSILFDGDTKFNKALPDGGNYWQDHDCTKDATDPKRCSNAYTIPVPVLADKSDNLPWACKNAWLPSVSCTTTTTVTPTVTVSTSPPATAVGEWAEVKKKNQGTSTYYDDEALTKPLKDIPNGWVVRVIQEKGAKAQIQDPIDNIIGWMNLDELQKEKDADEKALFKKRGENTYATKEDRFDLLKEVFNTYTKNSSTSNYLYSWEPEFDGDPIANNNIPGELLLGIAAQESGNYDNALVTPDYGHGIKQLTPLPVRYDVYYLLKILATEGYYSANFTIDTAFTGLQQNAVKAFQEDKKIIGDSPGQVSTNTIAKLNELIVADLSASPRRYPDVPSYFRFLNYMKANIASVQAGVNYVNRTKSSEGRGLKTGLAIYPCDNLDDFQNKNHLHNCYSGVINKLYSAQPFYNNRVFVFYNNTYQSIFSNIKDGFGVLIGKYKYYKDAVANKYGADDTKIIFRDPDKPSTVISVGDLKMIIAVKAYNGVSRKEKCPDGIAKYPLSSEPKYLSAISSKLKDKSIGYLDNAVALDYAAKLDLAVKNKEEATLCSPAFLQVWNSAKQMTGYIGSTVKYQIYNVVYDDALYEVAETYFPDESYTYRVVGKETGTYKFYVENVQDGNGIVFSAVSIPTVKGAVHEYSFDWVALRAGKVGTTIKIDQNGDGIFETVTKVNVDFTANEFMKAIEDNKITICHIPPGNSGNAHTLSIGKSALKAHLGHGDYEGECRAPNATQPDTKVKTEKDNNGVGSGKEKEKNNKK